MLLCRTSQWQLVALHLGFSPLAAAHPSDPAVSRGSAMSEIQSSLDVSALHTSVYHCVFRVWASLAYSRALSCLAQNAIQEKATVEKQALTRSVGILREQLVSVQSMAQTLAARRKQ